VEIGVLIMVEIEVSVPKERLGEFYALLSRFFESPGVEDSVEDSEVQPVDAGARAGRASTAKQVTGRYAPLYAHLLRTPGGALEMSFSEIERVLGGALPPSTRKHRPCWANSQGNYFGQSWLYAGWKVDKVDLQNERVAFKRD